MTKLKNIDTIRYGLFLYEYMANTLKNRIHAHIQNKLDKHIEKHGHRHVRKFLHHINNFQHNAIHIWELIAIVCIGRSSILFASYNTSYETYHRKSISEANVYLQDAIKTGKPKYDNMISTRSMDSSINNTFAAWYCTYGAARISPEFFPYSTDKTSQQRTWWGNAIDRCENAAETGFTIWATPQKWALVVYNPWNWISSLWHVGKVMYVNNKTKYMVVRDMNRLTRGIMADHRENTSTANIKCYIYPKTSVIEEKETEENQIEENNTNNETNENQTEINQNEQKEPDSNNQSNNNTNSNNGSSNEKETSEKENNHNSAANQEPENLNWSITIQNLAYTSKISINTEEVSDIAKHFLEQYKITIEKTSKEYPLIGDRIILNIKIQDKTTNEYFNGILPFSVKIITSNNNISSPISQIQLWEGSSISLDFDTKKSGTTTILISLDDNTIAKIPVTTIE